MPKSPQTGKRRNALTVFGDNDFNKKPIEALGIETPEPISANPAFIRATARQSASTMNTSIDFEGDSKQVHQVLRSPVTSRTSGARPSLTRLCVFSNQHRRRVKNFLFHVRMPQNLFRQASNRKLVFGFGRVGGDYELSARRTDELKSISRGSRADHHYDTRTNDLAYRRSYAQIRSEPHTSRCKTADAAMPSRSTDCESEVRAQASHGTARNDAFSCPCPRVLE
jgi:hypothetical protein